MNRIKQTLWLGLGALGAALMLSAPAAAAASPEAGDSRHRIAQVSGHQGQEHGAQSAHRGFGFDLSPHQGQFRTHQVHYRGHYRHGYRHWPGYRWRGYHWRRHYWRGHRPYWRHYRHYPRYRHRYG